MWLNWDRQSEKGSDVLCKIRKYRATFKSALYDFCLRNKLAVTNTFIGFDVAVRV